jgi:hypothetical protein
MAVGALGELVDRSACTDSKRRFRLLSFDADSETGDLFSFDQALTEMNCAEAAGCSPER